MVTNSILIDNNRRRCRAGTPKQDQAVIQKTGEECKSKGDTRPNLEGITETKTTRNDLATKKKTINLISNRNHVQHKK